MIERRGLVVRVLTDKLLFDSGQATLKPGGLRLLDEIANLLNVDQTHPIVVEGHTDNVPIATAQFPTNWELSTARATTVVRYLITRGVDRYRLGAVGYADLHPIASNATAAGRALNRRVEIVLMRLNPVPHPEPRSDPEPEPMKKKILIIAPVAAARRRLRRQGKLMPPKVVKTKIAGKIYILPKQFTLNLQDGQYATLTVALELAPGQSDGATADRHARRRHRGRHAARGGGGPGDHHQHGHQPDARTR